MTFNDKDRPEDTELYVGTVDEEFLIGTKVPGSDQETEHGVKFERHGGFERDAFVSGSRFYLENAVAGITDHIPGTKYLKTEQEGKGFV